MSLVSLDPTTTEARELTAELIRASQGRTPSLTIWCAIPQCQTVLARAGHTSAGPLFTSTWTVPAPRTITEVNGAPLTRSAERGFIESAFGPVACESGPPLERDLAQGVFAAVAPPPGQADDHPPLLVRCAEHGDAVLDRVEVMAHLRDGRTSWAVAVGFPRVEYADPDSTWLPGENSRQQRSRQSRRRR